MKTIQRVLAASLLLVATLASPGASHAQSATAGEGLYNGTCVNCHGNPPHGGPERGAANNPDFIRSAIGRVPPMASLAYFTDTQLADIAAYIGVALGITPPPPPPPTPPPAPELNYTALWWNPAESGWGINFNHQGSILFATLFTYDATGAPMWLVMSSGNLQADGVTFLGTLYRTTGPAFNANPFTPITADNLTTVGSMSVTFGSTGAAVLNYSVNGVSVRKDIQRLVYGTRAATCTPETGSRAAVTNYQDLWWKPDESGWGINVTHQDQTLFATLFTYEASGKGLWLILSAGIRQPDGSYLGDLYRTTGPAFNAQPFTPIGAANLTKVGTMQLRFTTGVSGTLSYTVNGVAVTKQIARMVFSSPAPSCAS